MERKEMAKGRETMIELWLIGMYWCFSIEENADDQAKGWK